LTRTGDIGRIPDGVELYGAGRPGMVKLPKKSGGNSFSKGKMASNRSSKGKGGSAHSDRTKITSIRWERKGGAQSFRGPNPQAF